MRRKRKHQSRWATRQNKKDPVYFCGKCLQTFRTGRFSRFDDIIYDDICPYCGAPGMTFIDVVEEYKYLLEEENKRGKH